MRWPNVLPPPKSTILGTFPWMGRLNQTRVLLIISHPLPGRPWGTDFGEQYPHHLLGDLQLIQITLHSYRGSQPTVGGSSTRFIYECCQAQGTVNDMAKQSAVGKEKRRTVCHMQRFDCHSRMCIALHNGIAVVDITHHQSHKLYISIDLPEKWHTFIKINHKMGPAKVCKRSEGPPI